MICKKISYTYSAQIAWLFCPLYETHKNKNYHIDVFKRIYMNMNNIEMMVLLEL